MLDGIDLDGGIAPRDRKIMAYVTMSADGYIARLDGDTSWATRRRKAGTYGLSEIRRVVDTIIADRATYEEERRCGPPPRPNVRRIVFESDPARRDRVPGVEFTAELPADFARRLRAEKGRHALLLSGNELLTAFLDAGVLDYLFLRVIPTFIGDGIPLLTSGARTNKLAVCGGRRYFDGVILTQYGVSREFRRAHRPSVEADLEALAL